MRANYITHSDSIQYFNNIICIGKYESQHMPYIYSNIVPWSYIIDISTPRTLHGKTIFTLYYDVSWRDICSCVLNHDWNDLQIIYPVFFFMTLIRIQQWVAAYTSIELMVRSSEFALRKFVQSFIYSSFQ